MNVLVWSKSLSAIAKLKNCYEFPFGQQLLYQYLAGALLQQDTINSS